MHVGNWIRLDIPYAPDAKHVRAVLVYTDKHGVKGFNKIKTLNSSNLTHLFDEILAEAEHFGIQFNQNTTLVFPPDSRHGIAREMSEWAQQHKMKFSRYVPQLMSLPIDFETEFENFETGSLEDHLTPHEAGSLVSTLNNNALNSFQQGDIQEALTHIRHAMWLSLRHFYWFHPASLFTLKNFGHIVAATNHRQNEAAYLALILKLIYLWKDIEPDTDIWFNSDDLFNDLATLCINLNADEIGFALFHLKNKVRITA